MDNRIAPSRPQVVAATTAARPTPRPARVKFAEVLARGAAGVVQGAEAAMKNLPGAPLMAVAIRSAGGGSGAMSVGRGLGGPAMGVGGIGGGGMGVGGAGVGGAASAEGPGGAGTTGAGTGAEGGGVEGSLAQAQEMNMYYLQIQEAVNAQNRTFSALSNVMKAEHDTVKTAIGNIR
ncbi:MAG: hypothetical protein JWM74_463 [Myxococcaceae bacterium]|nr:hypothetical protein [Myxococcaceae bacterium]